MKAKMKKRLLIYVGLLFPFCIQGANPVIADIPVRVVNTGKMAVAPNSSGQPTTMYVPHSMRMTGDTVSVVQAGVTATGGHFYNDVTSGHVFTSGSSGKFRFNGCQQAAQWIQGTANRAIHHIDFPDVEVENRASVSLSPSMGMNVANLHLKAGRFILRSAEISATQSQVAHLLVKQGGTVTPNTGPELSALEKGVVEVELVLGQNRDKKFFGFASPFEKTYTDYFTFKVLLEPSNSGYVSIQDPNYTLQPGKSYFVGQDVFPYSTPQEIAMYYPVLEEYPLINGREIDFSDRVTDMLRLNRWHLDVTNPGITFAYEYANAYDGEQLNTQDVTVPLTYGYNYLGNPFTAPLRVNKLFTKATDAATDWKITRGLDDADPSDPDYLANPDLYARIWVPATAGATGHVPGTHRFTFSTSFLVGQKQGSTLSESGNGAEIQIAPMQMFVVWTDRNNVDITIPASERTHGNMNLLKSAADYTPTDELLIQVRDTDTDAIDRLCVLFRENSSTGGGDTYDAGKLFNNSGGVSQIFNRTRDGSGLSVNQVNTGLDQMTLSLRPCLTEKEVELTAHRLETLLSPDVLLLEDLQTGITTDLLETASYSFITRPDDREDRFVLHFKTPTGMEDVATGNIRVYRHNDMLRITGLMEMDNGSRLTVYDMQGRSIFSTLMQDCRGGTFETPLSITQGVYVVKISGNRHATEKLIYR